VGILGPLEVTSAAGPVEVGGVRLRALLARLALAAGRPVPPSVLVDDLWGDDPPADAANALQTLVSRLRRALGDPVAVTSGQAGYALAAAPDDVDAVAFGRLAARGGADRDAGALEAALALWRGEALAGLDGVPFAAAEAARLDGLRVRAGEDLVAALLDAGRPDAALARAEALAAANPLREQAQALHLRALAASGRTADALVGYEALRTRLADELGVDPSPQLQALHAGLLRGTPPATPPVPAAPAAPQAVAAPPAPLSSFVGREADVDAVTVALSAARLVTLVGPGGAGKTRLAGEVGRRRAGAGGEVRLVELAPHGADDVTTAVADALGVRDRVLRDSLGAAPASGPELDRVADALGGRRVLLLLDNCEHVVDEAARVAEQLLGRCPGLVVLATSREPLRIGGERLHPVGPLGVPAGGADPEQALAHPAVRLLADRAAAVRPGFTVDATTVGPVVEICRRLDGMPLAIELAAARLRSLPPDVLAARLDDRFGLLTGGSRTALPRHQTLRAVVAWSWDLLDDAERAVAEQVCVFAGSFDEDAAAAVCPDVPDVADVLLALVDKSLLHVADDEPGRLRYRALETIREFGVERLAATGRAHDVRDRHAQRFLDLAETAEPFLRTADQLTWLALLGADRPNLLAALRWLVAERDAARAVRLGAALAWFWTLRGAHAEAHTWLRAALALDGDRPPLASAVAVVALALNERAVLQHDGDAPLEDVVALARAHSGEHPLLLLVEPGLAMLRGDRSSAAEAIVRHGPTAKAWPRAALHLFAALLAENDGDVATAMREAPAALEGFRAIGDRWGTGTALTVLGGLLAPQGRLEEALSMTEEASRCLRELGAVDDAVGLEVRSLGLRARLGRLDGVRERLETVLAVADEQVSAQSIAFARFGLADVARREGRLADARTEALAALGLVDGVAGTVPQVESIICAGLAWIEARSGRPDAGWAWLRRPVVRTVVGFDMPVAAAVAVAAAHVTAVAGDDAAAARLLGVADALRGTPDLTDPDVLGLRAELEARLGADAVAALVDAARAAGGAPARELLAGLVGADAPARGDGR
jgi:predicted ATPase/DNA-binding SARP family transcriptional activator